MLPEEFTKAVLILIPYIVQLATQGKALGEIPCRVPIKYDFYYGWSHAPPIMPLNLIAGPNMGGHMQLLF